MKKVYALIAVTCIGLFCLSCLEDEKVANVSYAYKGVDSVEILEIRPVNEVTQIKSYFTRTSSCENFFDYTYDVSGIERYVTFTFSKTASESCSTISESTDFVMDFKPDRSGIYRFRFWKGLDANGRDIFIEKEINIP